jgi:hypothetical protein
LCMIISFNRILEQLTFTTQFLLVNLNSINISLNAKIQKTSHDNYKQLL